MWAHRGDAAQCRAAARRRRRDVGPNAGEMAERGEAGLGRMAEPLEIAAAVDRAAAAARAGRSPASASSITSGPTHEPIDPVRYIANRSSGKQGHAIARGGRRRRRRGDAGVSGPVNVPDPPGVTVVHVETRARDARGGRAGAAGRRRDLRRRGRRLARRRRPARRRSRRAQAGPPQLSLIENPDILATVAHRKARRPQLVIGFAAETENVIDNAKAKLTRKGCDWIVANDVSPETGVMGGDRNTVHLVTARRRRDLAAAIQGRGCATADRAHRGRAWS